MRHILIILIGLLIAVSCATPRGLALRHERKLARIKVDSIRASNTKLSRTTRDYNIYTPFNGYQYNWYGTGFGHYRPQVVIPIRINKKRRNNGNNSINPRGGRNRGSNAPRVQRNQVQRPKVRAKTLPVRTKGRRGQKQ